MKRLVALALALAMLLSATALAFNGSGYPQWDGSSIPDDSLCVAFGQDRLTLRFDPATDYSNVEDGVIQACFFAYDAAETHYLEFYLLMPQLVMPGDVLRSGGEMKCSICLYETAVGDEDFYYAGDVDDRMSGDTSYELTIDSVEGSGTYLRVSGSAKALLCRYERNQPTQDTLSVDEAYFDFTMPLSAATAEPGSATPTPPPGQETPAPTFPTQPDDSQAPGTTFPALPAQTLPPTFPGLPETQRPASGGPSFTLPPDYAVI